MEILKLELEGASECVESLLTPEYFLFLIPEKVPNPKGAVIGTGYKLTVRRAEASENETNSK